MFSIASFNRRLLIGGACTALATGSASAQVFLLPAHPPSPSGEVVCSGTQGNIFLSSSADDCSGPGVSVTQIAIGSVGNDIIFDSSSGATFNLPANFNDNVQFSGLQAFSGTTTFNSNVTVNNNMATNGISNTGLITTGSLSSSTIFGNSATITNVLSANGTFTGSLSALAGATVNMGGNQVHGVADGTADTDAVNVAQLNAATSGIATDITALETTTATHTTQIATLETTSATHTTQIATHTTQISTLQTTVGAQATQITALQAADLVFDTRIDALDQLTAGLDERIGKVDDRASAGTAAAVALSGAMFLPGKTFNLTGNVGSYRGAHAAAVQFGALVSDNLAVNAGVAHGFNKGGKTAFRAGFTIGW